MPSPVQAREVIGHEVERRGAASAAPRPGSGRRHRPPPDRAYSGQGPTGDGAIGRECGIVDTWQKGSLDKYRAAEQVLITCCTSG